MAAKNNETESAAPALEPIEQRQVLFEGEEVVAVWAGQQDIYLPLRPLCEALGVQLNGQIARIKRDEVIAEGLRPIRVATEGGPQTMQALHLESVPLWLAGLEPSRVRVEVRPRLRVFKRWVRQRVWEAFAAEMGLTQAMPSAPIVDLAVDPAILSLEQVVALGRALVTLGEQQLRFHQEHHLDMIEVRGTLADHAQRLSAQEQRLDKAAEVIGATIRDVRALKTRLEPGNIITDAQAAELLAAVKAVATELTRQSAASGQGQTNYYASIFGELHRRYRVTSYKNLTVEQYAATLNWLREYSQALAIPDSADHPNPE